jgi:hypothetical protein
VAVAVPVYEHVFAETRAPLIEFAAVEKVYRMGKLDYHALRGVDLSIGSGELSISDLTRRRLRTVFAVLTLALAVASIGISEVVEGSEHVDERSTR